MKDDDASIDIENLFQVLTDRLQERKTTYEGRESGMANRQKSGCTQRRGSKDSRRRGDPSIRQKRTGDLHGKWIEPCKEERCINIDKPTQAQNQGLMTPRIVEEGLQSSRTKMMGSIHACANREWKHRRIRQLIKLKMTLSNTQKISTEMDTHTEHAETINTK